MQLNSTMTAGAVLSECGRFRYTLDRQWEEGEGTVNWIMLNPSKADADTDDPTIKRCIDFSRRWGYRRLEVTNLFALRATDPKRLRRSADPIGPENDGFIVSVAFAADLIVCAWGAQGGFLGRDRHVLGLLAKLNKVPHRLGVTKDGRPVHPLYLPADLMPGRFD